MHVNILHKESEKSPRSENIKLILHHKVVLKTIYMKLPFIIKETRYYFILNIYLSFAFYCEFITTSTVIKSDFIDLKDTITSDSSR